MPHTGIELAIYFSSRDLELLIVPVMKLHLRAINHVTLFCFASMRFTSYRLHEKRSKTKQSERSRKLYIARVCTM